MTKIERFKAIDKCLFWKEKKILIVGDLHLGYENYLHERGWSFPKTLLEDTLIELEKILDKTGKLKEIVLLGDVKHYFSGILQEEFSDVFKVIELLLKYCEKIVITKGNHDNILEPITRKYKEIELVDKYVVEDTIFLHGNKQNIKANLLNLYDRKVKLIVIGHIHPAIFLKEAGKIERYKAFLYGKDKKLKKKMIVVPSFFVLNEGINVVDKPEIDNFDFSNFNCYLVADKVYDFKKIKNIKSIDN